MDSPLGMLLFFAIFEIPGGGGFGAGLRGLLKRQGSQTFFFLIWGAGYGGIPLIIGAAMFLSAGQLLYFVVQLAMFFIPMLFVALVPTELWEPNLEGISFTPAIVGAVLTLVGGGILVLTLRDGIIVGMIVGGIFALVGAIVLFREVLAVLRAKEKA